MGLVNGSLQIGRSALLTHQAAMQVIGNNVANAGNPDFTRQSAILSPIEGVSLAGAGDPGAGVQMTGIERHIDTALEERLRQSLSDKSYDDLVSTTLGRLETLYNEMSDNDLSTGLNDFFNAFSKLQTTPQDVSARTVVTQTAQSLTQQIKTLRKDIVGVYNELGDTMTETVDQINRLSGQIADLNVRIANAKSGGDTAGALLDKRDSLLKDLSSLTNINCIEQTNGEVTIYIDSDPLVQANQARKLEVFKKNEGDIVIPEIIFSDNQRQAHVTSGKAGAIYELVNTLVGGNLKQLDTLAAGLINEVNKIHAQGQGLHGYTSLTSANLVTDPGAAVNVAGLAATPVNGSFLVTMTDKNTNQQTVTQLDVNLSGLGTQTTLNSLSAQLNGVTNLTATVRPDGKLQLATDNNHSFTFSEDSSGVLAALGLNGFFTGTNAADIAVNTDLVTDPQLVACAKNNLPGDGTNAAAISLLRTGPAQSFNGLSITDYYRSIVGNVGTQTASAKNNLDIHSAISDTLQAQRETVSGVSIDEETINLMSSQQAFQGAARFVTVVNQMIQEVLKLI
jgi:flagellar hook-associated protein 1